MSDPYRTQGEPTPRAMTDLEKEIAALEAEAEAAEKEAKASELTDAERAKAAAIARAEAAHEAKAAAEATRRAGVLHTKEKAARAKAGGAYLVKGIDLVGCFLLGNAPAAGQLPGGGVIVVRDPTPEANEVMMMDFEAKSKSVQAIMGELLCASTVDPDPSGTDGVTLKAFVTRYPGAAQQAGVKVRDLGGAKTAADKRGR